MLNKSENQGPKPADAQVLGTVDYYKFRYDDFVRRFPDKEPPAYYMMYGDKYVRKFTGELYEKLSEDCLLYTSRCV